MNNEVVKRLMQIESQLADLFKQKNELVTEFPKQFPEGFCAFQNPDETWTRITVTDNAEKLDEGFFKTVRVERYTLKIETLKNMPKELKEVKQ